MPMKPICRQCAKPLIASQSIRDGTCLVCRILNEDQGREEQKNADAALGRMFRAMVAEYGLVSVSRGEDRYQLMLDGELEPRYYDTLDEAVTRAREGTDGRQ